MSFLPSLPQSLLPFSPEFEEPRSKKMSVIDFLWLCSNGESSKAGKGKNGTTKSRVSVTETRKEREQWRESDGEEIHKFGLCFFLK